MVVGRNSGRFFGALVSTETGLDGCEWLLYQGADGRYCRVQAFRVRIECPD